MLMSVLSGHCFFSSKNLIEYFIAFQVKLNSMACKYFLSGSFCAYVYFLSLISSYTPFISALKPPLWVIQRKRDRYERNAQCMGRRSHEFDRYGLQPFKAITALENTTLWLKCFQCLHPDDADELEDVWKPSPSVIGRKIHKFLKMIKEKISRSRTTNAGRKSRGDLSTYRWEKHLSNEKSKLAKGWSYAQKYFEEDTTRDGRKNESMVIGFVEEIMSKADDTKNFFIGDHLELEIRKIDAAKKGWYRCVNHTTAKDTTGGGMQMSQLYFVDVLERTHTIMFDSNASESKKPEEWKKVNFLETKRVAEDPPLELYWRYSDWTICNKCGERVGEKRRTWSCYLRRPFESNPTDYATEQFEVFLLFAELPCQSSLIPSRLKTTLGQHHLTIFEEFINCSNPCDPSKRNNSEVRTVAINETGREEVLDVLPPGEYSTNERLPPLAPPIIRRTLFLTENDWVVLDCSNQDGLPLIWRKNFEEINATLILMVEDGKDMQRRILTAQGMLLIRSARREDSGLYSCTAFPSGHILRTFRIFVDIGDRTNEVMNAISLAIRSLLFAFLLLLLCDLINVQVPNS